MNNVQAFIDRQIGNYNWKYCDTAITKLRCRRIDEYNEGRSENCESDPPVFACKFAESYGNEHILALANEDGEIGIYNTEYKGYHKSALAYRTDAHFNAIFDLAWMFGQMKLVSVSGDHTARLFDVGRSHITEERVFHGHTRTIKTVAFRKEDPAVFATGARDGAIFVWDTRAHYNYTYITQPDRIIANSHYISTSPGSGSKFRKKSTLVNLSGANSVTSLVFQDDMTLISCGAGDGAIKVWDLRKNYGINKREPIPKCVLPYMGNSTRYGFTNLLVDCSGMKLYANCLDNTIYCYNIAMYHQEPIMTYVGHQISSFYVKSSISADGKYIVSGSSDQNAYIWNTNKSTPLVSLVGHTAEVTCVAWCSKGTMKLVTCADDMKHKIWRVYGEDDSDDWRINGYGSAVCLEDKAETKLLSTPKSRKRYSNSTPHSQRKRSKICEKCQLLTPGTAASLVNCENCLITFGRSAKRTSSQAELSPEKTSKKQQPEKSGARRLFAGLYETKETEGDLATIIEEASSENCDTFVPTANLPNFVVDGMAPHLKNYSPPKKRDKDWLTKLRIEQTLRNQMQELSRPSSPKQPRLSEQNSNSPSAIHPAKRQKRTPSTSKTQSPLLKFFRVTNSSRSCENNQCSSLLSSSPILQEVKQKN